MRDLIHAEQADDGRTTLMAGLLLGVLLGVAAAIIGALCGIRLAWITLAYFLPASLGLGLGAFLNLRRAAVRDSASRSSPDGKLQERKRFK